MLRKKVCLLGAAAVGKTSLVRRFVESLFSEEYLSTVGVKVDRKQVALPEGDVTLLVWDIHGEHGTLTVLAEYLRGSAAYLVVVDAERPEETAKVAETILGRRADDCPYVLAVNKSDLVDDRPTAAHAVESLVAAAAAVVWTSAKTGEGVDKAFTELARAATA